jgi:hypothetical protein
MDILCVSYRLCRFPSSGRVLPARFGPRLVLTVWSSLLGHRNCPHSRPSIRYTRCADLSDRVAWRFGSGRIGYLSRGEPICGQRGAKGGTSHRQWAHLCGRWSRQRTYPVIESACGKRGHIRTPPADLTHFSAPCTIPAEVGGPLLLSVFTRHSSGCKDSGDRTWPRCVRDPIA